MLRREFIKYLTAGAAGEFILPATMANAATSLNVVIIGGGMAGATAAKYLRVWATKLGLGTSVSVTLIDINDTYTSNIMSNMVLTGERTLTSLKYSYANLQSKYGVTFVKGTVTSVDFDTGWVYGLKNNIGLPDKVAYACLAETIVLALEGRFETFTIGRNIEWEKVREIYKMGLKHGMKLAAISGVNGVYTDEDLARVRKLALQKRKVAKFKAPDSNAAAANA